MDIRKFFGGGAGVKKGTAGQSANNNLTLQRNTTGKAKHGCSTFERQQTEQPVKSRKRTSSKSKSETNGDIEDSLIIDDSSDDDVIPCSLNSTPAQKIEKFDKSAVAPNFKRNDDITTNSKREVKSYHEKRKSTNGKDLKEDNLRRSPRKQQSVNVNSGKIFSSKKSKHIQISDDDDEVSRIGETSSEDNEDVTAPIKRRTGGNTKRGRKAVNVLDSESDDEDPVPQKIPQSKRKKKSVSLDNDSDEEKAQTPMDKFVKKKRSPVSKIETGVAKTEVPKSAQVNVSDFFGTGSASASRVERSVGEKRKRDNQGVGDKTDKMTVVFEEEIHDDEDFLKVLDELDGPKVKKVKLLQPKEDATTSKGSLASRLSNKMKAKPNEESVLMKEATLTPLKKISSPQKSSALQKRKSSYTLEDTAPKSSFPKTAKVDKKGGNKTPEKSASVPKALMYSGKKDTDKEDDGFGTKKTGGFRAFKMRGGPLALGSKEIPEGAENCLEGMAFVVTGVLDSIERDDAKSMVEKYGGKVTTSLSKKTSYLVVGREPGESKLVKAKDLKVMQIDEDGLFDLVKTLPGKTSKYEVQAKQQLKQEESFKLKSEKERSTSLKKLQSFQSDKANDAPSSSSTVKQLFTKLRSSDEKHPSNMVKNEMEQQQESRDASIHEKPPESLLWVDKHKPNTMKQIIGQQGDKSNAHKLLYWIKHWYDNIIIKGTKTSGNYFGKGSGDGTGFRAALLSGPPGIGKTTTATLVCKEAGFSYVELNASDTRSKRSLKEVIAESLNNQTLVDFVGDEQKKGQQRSLHHCLIMDEVDGMAGNEDRGGLQELVQLIRNTKIPILCICNDRNSMKMRTLSNYCFDLRFQRPRVEQIKGAMMTLAFREGVKIPPSAVQEIILAANHDIRQVIHNLSMWTATEKNLTFEQVKEDAQKAQKDLKLGPFDVCRKVFVSDETKKMSINDKSDLFFHDYSFAPLFVHENYPHVIPTRAEGKKSKHMACLAHTIDSLCDGDLVEKLIRNGGNWNLLPIQAMYSSVLPGEYMRGSFPQMTNFPLWLGKNSTTGKTDRILQELGMHMGLKISCDKRGLNQDYIPALRTCLTAPLASHGNDGVPGVIQVMDDYDIIKDDFDNILEVSKWPNSIDYMTQVESKTKAALTRMYNKSGHMTPYSSGMGGKKKGKGRAVADGDDNLLREEYDGEAVAESEEEEDEPVIVSKPKGKTAKSKQNIGEKNKGKSGGGKGRK